MGLFGGNLALGAGPLVLPQEALDALKAYLRVHGDDEDALLTDMLGASAEICERFTGLALIAREHGEVIAASGAWTMLSAMPVWSIGPLWSVAPGCAGNGSAGNGAPQDGGGNGGAIPVGLHEIDIDAEGRGWVRIESDAARRAHVTYRAGLASAWQDLPEALTHGLLRLAGHLYLERDGGKTPPAAVSALWRPWRRMNLGRSGQRHVRAG